MGVGRVRGSQVIWVKRQLGNGVHLGLGPAVLLKRAGFHAPEPASSLSLVGAVLPLGSCQDSRPFSWF